MSAQHAWTPAPRPGIIPLHPLGFGTILGRSFAALRHNPAVLFGFALGVQAIAFIILLVGIGGIGWLTFSRLDTLREGTEEYDAVLAGSALITGLAAFVLGLLATALQVIVQAVVVGEVSHAVVAEKLRLATLWRHVRPSLGRLLAYAALLLVAIAVLVGIVTAAIIAIGVAVHPAVAIALTVLVILGAIPLTLWLNTKLLLVPSILILERTTIRASVARSWVLVRGRFWAALGVIVIISLLFGTISQFVSLPLSFLSSGLTTIFAPTGEPNTGAVIAIVVTVVLTYVITLAIQAVGLVVQSTASVLIYIDCRMRREGLDIELLRYVERRDAGDDSPPDPWRPRAGGPSSAPPAPPGWGQPPYPAQPPYPTQAPYAGQQPYPTQPPYPPQPPYPAQPPYAAPQQPPPAPPVARDARTWAPPTAGDGESDPQPPS
ncbi:hypothetical protein [Microbacterium lacus]|uniref:hypothetical protein n=1 Tax=Microbacterium lacus TaxID=415217 RepID=UPI000C2B5F28|nr:hypothetical protein [Microbacterium lacus]